MIDVYKYRTGSTVKAVYTQKGESHTMTGLFIDAPDNQHVRILYGTSMDDIKAYTLPVSVMQSLTYSHMDSENTTIIMKQHLKKYVSDF